MLWRNCILQFAEAKSWRVPTPLEALRDRFKCIPWDSKDPLEVCINELLGPPDEVSQNRASRLKRLAEGVNISEILVDKGELEEKESN